MKKVIGLFVFLFSFVTSGCGISTFSTAQDPATYRSSQDVTTPGNSRIIEQHCKSKIVGGCDGYGEGVRGIDPRSTLVVQHPPVRMIPMVDQSNGQRAMGDIPGSVMIMHPGATNGLNQRLDQMQRDQDTITIVVAQDHEDVKKMKKNAGKDPKKSPPANEAGGAPSVDP